MPRHRPLAHALVALACLTATAPPPASAGGHEARVSAWSEAQLPGLVALYRELHARPELSFEEHATAARVAGALRDAGFEVTTEIGRTGVVGLLRNGPGPTVMIRGDMDALPVSEATGLDYASAVRVTREDGSQVGVMHACGHDLHTANLVGTARLLADQREHWSGTLLTVAQPAEEIGQGAHAMLGEGLFERFPAPDFTLALHVESSLAAGEIGLTPGWAMANVDAVDVVIHGRGGHGARPQSASDPIVTAAYFVTALQTLVSRRVDPREPAVVTVGSFHAGHKHNVIPDEARLQLTVRSYTDAVRAELLEGIRRTARETCAIWECPREPEIAVRDLYTPAVYNDPALAARAAKVFEDAFGAERVRAHPPSMGGEDFGRYGRALGVPSLLFRVGVQDPARVAEARAGGAPPPSIHSSRFAPVPEPSLRTALEALALLALDLFASPEDPGGER